MTFIISLFYDPSRVKRARYKRGPFWWRWFKDQYIYDYCCVYLYGWLTKRFWVVGSKIADPNIRVRPEHALDKIGIVHTKKEYQIDATPPQNNKSPLDVHNSMGEQ
eukprot:scaffold13693_cov114-Skeletonema_marinoi.AAC.4